MTTLMRTRAGTNTIGAFEAKTRLSELLDRVEAGEVIVITRHGAPIATLQPYAHSVDPEATQRTIDGILELRAELLATGPGLSFDEIRTAIREGRS